MDANFSESIKDCMLQAANSLSKCADWIKDVTDWYVEQFELHAKNFQRFSRMLSGRTIGNGLFIIGERKISRVLVFRKAKVN